MVVIGLDPKAEAQLSELALRSGRTADDLASEWIAERRHRERMYDRIRAVATLGADERAEVADWAAGEATDAWLLVLDAEDAATTGDRTGRRKMLIRSV